MLGSGLGLRKYLFLVRCTPQLKDEDGLFEVLSDTIFEFIKLKGATFPDACVSREHFWRIDSWKRAMTGMFLIRFALEMPAQKAWNKFLVDDLKFNKRVIKRLMVKETEIWSQSTRLRNLPRDVHSPSSKQKKRGRVDEVASFSDTESPTKKRFAFDSDTTDDDE